MTALMPVRGQVEVPVAGLWKIIARQPYAEPLNITSFRGSPTQFGDFSFSDPFGPKTFTLTFPQVTYFERHGGHGDIAWLKRGTNVDVYWEGPIPTAYPYGVFIAGEWVPQWRWEGYITAMSWDTDSGMTVQIQGAMYQLDRYMAKKEYAGRPLPYEWAIYRQFLDKPALRLLPPKIVWPDWWELTYTPPPKATPSYYIPAGVSAGENWTGLLTRSTGNWDPVMTSYINSLLAAMYTERGRWTLDLLPNRLPELRFLEFLSSPDEHTIVIDPTAPGTKINLTEDGQQALTDVYIQGTSLAGVSYSGMSVSADGETTTYIPGAALRQTYPPRSDNSWYDPQVMPMEVLLQVQQGLNADDSITVARSHLSRFADPGMTGTIKLESDPTINGETIPRHLVRAGLPVQIPWLFGHQRGLMGRISESSHSPESGVTSLTIDTKQRDALTVEEVKIRGRDSLAVSRMLIAGQYQPPIPDQLFPWSYAEGSGFIPSNAAFNARPLFEGMPGTVQFPWTEWMQQRPPRDSRWTNCYLHLGSAQDDATANWIVQHTASGSGYGVPIRMAQAGTIRLLQFAAYDINGNVRKVPFHFSLYAVGGVNALSMPKIPAEQAILFPPYAAGQPYPFVRDGFETFNVDGTRTNPQIPHPTDSVGLVKAWGTYYEKAGYFPGSYAAGDEPTGLLVDESAWPFDTTNISDSVFDPYNAERNLTNPLAGQLYAMIYCDAQGDDDIFFAGRMFRTEPGSET